MTLIGDRDFYQIELESDSVLDITISGIKGVNHAIRVWKGGITPKELKVIDDNRKSSTERIANIFAEAGTYYIEIFHGSKDPRKENKETPYELLIKRREPGVEESESNDTFDTANPITAESEVAGYYSPAYNRFNKSKDSFNREEDWYAIDVELNDNNPILLDVALSGVTGINSEVYLYDTQKNEIIRADGGHRGDQEELKGIGITESGKYYIMVTCKNYEVNHEEPYFLSVNFREYDASYEMENNNEIGTANEISNNEIAGEINSVKDVDYFIYQNNGSAEHAKIELHTSEKMDGKLVLYNHKMEKLISINNGGNGVHELFPNYYISNNLYIEVSSRSSGKALKDSYRLTVSPLSGQNYEIEPNDTKGQAMKIVNSLVKGYISKRSDKDYYMLSYDGRRKNDFSIAGVKDGEIKVSVTDQLGYIIKSVVVKGDRTGKLSEMIDKKGYIIVESLKENFENPYTIEIRGN